MISQTKLNASLAGKGRSPARSGARADVPNEAGRPNLSEDAERNRVRRDLTQALDLVAEHEYLEEKRVPQAASTPFPAPETLDAEQLVQAILGLADAALICHAGSYLRAAAKQPGTLALEALHARKMASGLFRHGTISGWQLKDSPFKAAIDGGHHQNIGWLLQLRAVPDAPLLAALPAMSPEVQQAFNDYEYTTCSSLITQQIDRPGPPSTRPPATPRTTGVKVLTYRGGDRRLTKDEIENIILFRPDTELFASESGLIRAAVEFENAEALIKGLCRRGVALHPRTSSDQRGWKPEDCPFQAASARKHHGNLRTLLEIGARPAPDSSFRQQLPTMESGIRDLFHAFENT